MEIERAIPLLGRDEEWATLVRALDVVREGSSQFVFVEGEAGIGKTRLIEELQATATATDFTLLSGRAEDLERMRPFGPIADALRRFDAEPGSAGQALKELFRRENPGAAGQPLTDVVLVDSFVEFLEESALIRPTCLVLEDLHWADEATLAAIRAVARRLSYLPILTIGTHRPHPRPQALSRLLDAGSREGAQELRLRPLDEPSLVALSGAILASGVGPTLREILRSSAGNPLYAIEIVRALSQEGSLSVSDGVADAAMRQLPPSFRLTMLRRISFLPAETLRLLQSAAFVGTSFGVQELATLADTSSKNVIHGLDPAIASKIVEERAGSLSFRHDLIRDAIYEDIPAPIRVARHLEIARALRSTSGDSVRIGEHLLRGLDAGTAEVLPDVMAVATQLRDRAPRMAVRLYEGLLRLGGIPEAQRDEIRLAMLHPLRATGRNNDVEGIVEEVLSKPQIPLIEAVARLERIETRVRDGRVADCVPELRRLRGDPRLDPGMRTVAGAALIGSQIRSGDTDGAATLAPVILEESRSQGNDYALGAALMAHALVSTWLGRVDQALQDASEAVEIDHRMRLVVAPHPALGIALLAGDRFADARRTFDQGRRREVEAGEVSSLALTVAGEAMVSFLAGEWEDAEAEAESALALTRDGGSHLQGIMAVYCVLGQIALRRGDLDTARRWVDEGDEVVTSKGPQLLDVLNGWTKALCLEAEGRDSAALTALAREWDRSAPGRYFTFWQLAAADLVRLALGSDDLARARSVTEQAEEGVGLSGHVLATEGAALRCRGLLGNDPEALIASVTAYRKTPRLYETALACEDAAVSLARKDMVTDARPLFDEALGAYERIRATRDAARAASSMREAGIRRGSRRPRRRPKTGWESLTPTEVQIARLTVEGLTNPQIADRLYVSKRTVQTHLSHIFVKLQISSRTQLAGIAVEKLPAG